MKTITLTEEMFASGKPIAQGEVTIWMKKYAPPGIRDKVAVLKDLRDMPTENGALILGHSETGHHHVLEPLQNSAPISRAAQALIDAANDTLVSLKIFEDCVLRHDKETDRHAAFILPPGEYIRGIREEQTIGGWTRVSD